MPADKAGRRSPWSLTILGARVVNAFSSNTNSDTAATATASVSEAERRSQSNELSNQIFLASGAYHKAVSAADYKYSANSIKTDLTRVRDRLQEALELDVQRYSYPTKSKKLEQINAFRTLAHISAYLGEYEKTKETYRVYFPPRFSTQDLLVLDIGVPMWLSHPISPLVNAAVELAMDYLEFLCETLDNLKSMSHLGEFISQVLEKAPPPLHEPYEQQKDWAQKAILLAKHNNSLGEFSGALSYIQSLRDLSNFVRLEEAFWPQLTLQTAIALSGLGRRATGNKAFVEATVVSAVICGMWHPTTLSVIHHFGKELNKEGDHQMAFKLLEECCIGCAHFFGESHPRYKEARAALGRCLNPPHNPDHHITVVDEWEATMLSRAYDHLELKTVVHLLADYGEAELRHAYDIVQSLLSRKEELGKHTTSEHVSTLYLRIYRAFAWCKFELGDTSGAIDTVKSTPHIIERGAHLILDLDIVAFLSRDPTTRGKSLRLSRDIYFRVMETPDDDQTKTIHRRLTQLNLTHFPFDATFSAASVIQTGENIGTGAYAAVDSVQINGHSFARKSIVLPRYSAKLVREAIQNEVTVMRSLVHPHIVKVCFTYEEKSRFAIVMEPLATCDLEAYLDQVDLDKEFTAKRLLDRWILCLANALAYIHSKGVRHKDIKPRNILVHNDKVLFADFGSSYVFSDEGMSTTEGPAFGHTLMYCAPEVVAWQKRSRSADIFSLGCVFSEIATVIGGRTVQDFYEFRCCPADNAAGETHNYHATLDRVHEWFDAEPVFDGVPNFSQDIISPMLRQEPERRPTASEVSIQHGLWFKDSQHGLRISHHGLWISADECNSCASVVSKQDVSYSLGEGHGIQGPLLIGRAVPGASKPNELSTSQKQISEQIGHQIRSDTGVTGSQPSSKSLADLMM